MKTLFIYGNQYENEIHAWILSSEELTSRRHIEGNWTAFGKCIDNIYWLITSYKPNQIVFEEKSEYEDSIWDAVTLKCDNKLDIGIDDRGWVTYYSDEKQSTENNEGIICTAWSNE